MRLMEFVGTHKENISRIGCYSAGAIIMYVVLKCRSKNYIVTNLVVSDLGKLGEELIKRGSNANDKVLKWKLTMERM